MGVIHVDVSDAARWFFEGDQQKEYVWANDFPVMTSPWPVAKYTWREPSYSNSEGRIIKSPFRNVSHEVTIFQGEVDHEAVVDGKMIDQLPAFLYRLTGHKTVLPDGSVSHFQRTTVNYALENNVQFHWMQLIAWRPSIEGLAALWLQFLDCGGHFIGGDGAGPIFLSGRGAPVISDPARAGAVLYPAIFALSLLHCKNIELRDRPVSRQQRRMAERSGKPVITYK